MDELKRYLKTVGYSWERLFRFFPLLKRKKKVTVNVSLRVWRGCTFIPCFFSAIAITDLEKDCNRRQAGVVSTRQPQEKAAGTWWQIHQRAVVLQQEASRAPAATKPEL